MNLPRPPFISEEERFNYDIACLKGEEKTRDYIIKFWIEKFHIMGYYEILELMLCEPDYYSFKDFTNEKNRIKDAAFVFTFHAERHSEKEQAIIKFVNQDIFLKK